MLPFSPRRHSHSQLAAYRPSAAQQRVTTWTYSDILCYSGSRFSLPLVALFINERANSYAFVCFIEMPSAHSTTTTTKMPGTLGTSTAGSGTACSNTISHKSFFNVESQVGASAVDEQTPAAGRMGNAHARACGRTQQSRHAPFRI